MGGGSAAPGFARHREKDNGGYRPKASALADFATALATRYSGSFVPDPAPSDPTPTALPRVSHVEPWNEPNLTGFLSPQWYDGKPYSIDMYRHLLNVVYKAYKAVQPHATMIAGGTGPNGEVHESRHIAPLMFFRKLLCLTKKLKAAECPVKARFDVLSHHPISPTTSPYRHAFGTDNATIPDMKKVKRILRAAERHHTTLPAGKHHRRVWATEFWWESNPPTRVYPAPSLRKQALYTEQGLRLLWQQRIPVALLFQVHDSPVLAGPPRIGWATGMLYNDDQPKPSYTAVHFPFVAERKSRKSDRRMGPLASRREGQDHLDPARAAQRRRHGPGRCRRRRPPAGPAARADAHDGQGGLRSRASRPACRRSPAAEWPRGPRLRQTAHRYTWLIDQASRARLEEEARSRDRRSGLRPTCAVAGRRPMA